MVRGSHNAKVGSIGRVIVRGYGENVTIDRQVQLVQMLVKHGVRVEARFEEVGFPWNRSHRSQKGYRNHGYLQTIYAGFSQRSVSLSLLLFSLSPVPLSTSDGCPPPSTSVGTHSPVSFTLCLVRSLPPLACSLVGSSPNLTSSNSIAPNPSLMVSSPITIRNALIILGLQTALMTCIAPNPVVVFECYYSAKECR
uniref:Uncharacterized protein n=1 Tax=Nelumbo nucifera TaxID=4432 RepID=A0A822YIX3_NELNU|nr:TPA_asm: hypothetical protein HUJ06_011293 [Nelumbo nucifera]